jgi:hypothetical protein
VDFLSTSASHLVLLGHCDRINIPVHVTRKAHGFAWSTTLRHATATHLDKHALQLQKMANLVAVRTAAVLWSRSCLGFVVVRVHVKGTEVV